MDPSTSSNAEPDQEFEGVEESYDSIAQDSAEVPEEKDSGQASRASAPANGSAATPSGKPAEGTVATGTVKWYDPTRHFGFIMPDIDDTDLFMHLQELVFDGEDAIQQVYKAQRVQFVYSWEGDRARARNVTQIGGSPLPSHPSLGNPTFEQRLKENPNVRTGVIKWFNPDKGYGFIIPTDPLPMPDTGEMRRADVFVHASKVNCAGNRVWLTDKSPVEFELDENVQQPPSGPPKVEAKNVTGPGGAAIMALPPGVSLPRGQVAPGGMPGGAPGAPRPQGMPGVAAASAPMVPSVRPNMFPTPAVPAATPFARMPPAAAAAAGRGPAAQIVSGPRYQGPVKWYNPEKGFGFILGSNEEEDLFMHLTSLAANDPKNVEIAKGQLVEYEITMQNGQQRAANVTLPGGLKLDDPIAAPAARAAAVPPPQVQARVGMKRKYSAMGGGQPGAGGDYRYSKSPRQSMYTAYPQQQFQQYGQGAAAFPAQQQQQPAASGAAAAAAAYPQQAAAQQAAAQQQYNQYYHPYSGGGGGGGGADAYDNQYM